MKIYSSIDEIKEDYEIIDINNDTSNDYKSMGDDTWTCIAKTKTGKSIVAMKIIFYDTFSGTPQHDYMIRYMVI